MTLCIGDSMFAVKAVHFLAWFKIYGWINGTVTHPTHLYFKKCFMWWTPKQSKNTYVEH